ncbi:MAG: tyrosine-type recombinase/integrase [Zoogloeaceae bacterium]|nr:tyrosine-type recombinase/integrase [Zoogloeaceae bacterium]
MRSGGSVAEGWERERLCSPRGRQRGADRKLRKIRAADVARAVRAVWEAGERAKARRVLSVARDLFAEAVTNGYLDVNPARHVRALPNRVRRRRLALADWVRAQGVLAEAVIPWRRVFALLALVTGQRRGDLVKMRFDDIWDGHLHVVQQKTGERIALPLALRLDAVGVSLGDVIRDCRAIGVPGETLLRKRAGGPLSGASLTKAWAGAFRTAPCSAPAPCSLAEIRSLAARLYRQEGVDAQTLLGHRRASTTAIYLDDRGLTREAGEWRTLTL